MHWDKVTFSSNVVFLPLMCLMAISTRFIQLPRNSLLGATHRADVANVNSVSQFLFEASLKLEQALKMEVMESAQIGWFTSALKDSAKGKRIYVNT
ncbi:hypothetical protein WICPIJ_005512 [Wickerhamomyces pijperi]|uniref:Uncharacterized protein n=1 Tax=Wickerhamomyces pijperi TaxID=599730 RepID=A0A9P8Q3Q6_WICPI|nr:hypothetical protein WICPIJ_005512 [Wickerhamomyces pijperi]